MRTAGGLYTLTRQIADLSHQVLGVILPQECAVCSREDWSVCPQCQSLVRRLTSVPFRAEAGAEALPWLPGHEFETILPVHASGRYLGPLAQAMLCFKDCGDALTVRLFSSILARALATLAAHYPDLLVVVVPVPSSLSARLKRGFSPLELLTKNVRRRCLLPDNLTIAPVLKHSTAHEIRHLFRVSQKQADIRHRQRLTRGKFTMRRRRHIPPDAVVVILDDVLTTGATIAEATRALVSHGIKPSAAVVLASTRSPRDTVEERKGEST